MVRSQSEGASLYDSIAEDGPMHEVAACWVLQSLISLVEGLPAYKPIYPEDISIRDNGQLRISSRAGSNPAADPACSGAEAIQSSQSDQSSPFAAPEDGNAGAGVAEAFTWNLGMIMYALLAGYTPFSACASSCPFFAEFEQNAMLVCPVRVPKLRGRPELFFSFGSSAVQPPSLLHPCMGRQSSGVRSGNLRSEGEGARVRSIA